mmetsp:Transcript_7393/g.18082  ORF Transcript_7393/g.18082 Transcript_7393/m.18082 type:complete len:259 (-) Transcript_7393:716-1492(-)
MRAVSRRRRSPSYRTRISSAVKRMRPAHHPAARSSPVASNVRVLFRREAIAYRAMSRAVAKAWPTIAAVSDCRSSSVRCSRRKARLASAASPPLSSKSGGSAGLPKADALGTTMRTSEETLPTQSIAIRRAGCRIGSMILAAVAGGSMDDPLPELERSPSAEPGGTGRMSWHQPVVSRPYRRTCRSAHSSRIWSGEYLRSTVPIVGNRRSSFSSTRRQSLDSARLSGSGHRSHGLSRWRHFISTPARSRQSTFFVAES